MSDTHGVGERDARTAELEAEVADLRGRLADDSKQKTLQYVFQQLSLIQPDDDDNRPIEKVARMVVARYQRLDAYAGALRASLEELLPILVRQFASLPPAPASTAWHTARERLERAKCALAACGHEICTHQHRILGGACAQCGDVTINGAGASSRESPRNEAVVADSSVPGKAASPLEPSARPSGATNECVHHEGHQP